MSSDITWAITRNNSSFLLKKRGTPKPFSTDPLNLTNRNCQRHNGYLNKKAVGVAAGASNKGLVLSTKKASRGNRPAKALNSAKLTSGARTSLTTISNTIRKQSYRKDLRKAALRRAAAIIRSQKPLPNRKGAKIAAAAAKKSD